MIYFPIKLLISIELYQLYHMYFHDPNSLMKTGKLAANDWDDESRCMIMLLTLLLRLRRRSNASLRDAAVLDCPSTKRSSPDADFIAHSK